MQVIRRALTSKTLGAIVETLKELKIKVESIGLCQLADVLVKSFLLDCLAQIVSTETRSNIPEFPFKCSPRRAPNHRGDLPCVSDFTHEQGNPIKYCIPEVIHGRENTQRVKSLLFRSPSVHRFSLLSSFAPFSSSCAQISCERLSGGCASVPGPSALEAAVRSSATTTQPPPSYRDTPAPFSLRLTLETRGKGHKH